ncbi:MAG: hypothetical protein ACJ8GN_19620 [Longimicrobiaceae bacterium]
MIMVHFHRFLTAKATDFGLMIEWLEHEFGTLEARMPGREHLYQELRVEVARAKQKLATLQLILGFGVTPLLDRAHPLVHSIQLAMNVLTDHYLPALQRETDGDRFVRALILDASKRFGIDWIRDVVVRLDSAHATFLAFQEIPLYFAPARHMVSLADMAGLYHEMGHGVFNRFPEIRQRLAAVVKRYFQQQLLAAGHLIPAKKERRDEGLRDGAAYWTPARLNEVFCDVFGTFTCGPAHYVSFVDLALRSKEDPYEIDLADAHPPLSARVCACFEALILPHRREDMVLLASGAWGSHEASLTKSNQYQVACAQPLLNALVGESLSCIADYLSGAARYSETALGEGALEAVRPHASMEALLNQSAQLLLLRPHAYAEWERQALREIRARFAA